MKHLIPALALILALGCVRPPAGFADAQKDLRIAQGIYAKGLAEYEAYHRGLERDRLARAITLFKDSFTACPNFSKSYYAIISALEELEAGSSEAVAESLRDLVDGLFDPFVSGGAAAAEIADLEVLGVCLERIRTLEAAARFQATIGAGGAGLAYEKLECPLGGTYALTDRGGTVEVACSIHGRPTGPAPAAGDDAATAARFRSGPFKLHLEAMALVRKAAFERAAPAAAEERRKAAQLFLKAAREDPKLVEATIGYLAVAEDGKLKPGELETLVAAYRKLLGDARLKRYGRLAAGDLLDLRYALDCRLNRLMVEAGLRMYLLNVGRTDPAKLDLDELVRKGYLKGRPACRKGGACRVKAGPDGAIVTCTVHGE